MSDFSGRKSPEPATKPTQTNVSVRTKYPKGFKPHPQADTDMSDNPSPVHPQCTCARKTYLAIGRS